MVIVAKGVFKLVEIFGTAVWEVIKLAVTIVDIIIQVVTNI